MIMRKTKIQLVAFAVISVVAVAYSLVRFAELDRVFGEDVYTVAVQLDEPGGIFPNAEVAYRGLQVGRVGDMRLTETGLEIDLVIEPDAPEIPADSDVVILNRSAIGEQFADIRPVTADGPFLEDGSLIEADRTKTPPGAEEVIDSAVQLADSIPHDSLRTVVSESYDGFTGTGDDLGRLIDNTSEFFASAQKHLPQTLDLLEHGNTVLNTFNEEAGSIASFSEDLRLLSETFKDSDADIRQLIDITPQSARQLSEVVHDIGPGLSAFIVNAITLGELSEPRLRGLEQVLLTYPALSAGALAVPKEGAGPDGTNVQARLGFLLSLYDPPSCVRGYEGTERRPGDDTSDRDHNTEAYCAEPKGSPINVRGSNNVPYHGVPDHPDAGPRPTQDGDGSVGDQRPDSGPPSSGTPLTLASLGDLLGAS